MKILKAEKYFYAHRQHPKVLIDMKDISYTGLTSVMNSRMPFITRGGSLYINTWIGRNPKYVLPGIGCTVEKLYEMYNETLHVLTKETLPRGIYDYVPSIDYSYYDTNTIDIFLENIDKGTRLVLIDNGKVFSQQAVNFDFTPVVHELANEHRDIIFVTTHKTELVDENVFDITDIMGYQSNNINEISYLSRFCDTLIGRCSGPHVFCQVSDNWKDSSKRLVSFTKTNYGSSFVLDSYKFPMGVRWSSDTNFFNVFTFCNNVILESRE